MFSRPREDLKRVVGIAKDLAPIISSRPFVDPSPTWVSQGLIFTKNRVCQSATCRQKPEQQSWIFRNFPSPFMDGDLNLTIHSFLHSVLLRLVTATCSEDTARVLGTQI